MPHLEDCDEEECDPEEEHDTPPDERENEEEPNQEIDMDVEGLIKSLKFSHFVQTLATAIKQPKPMPLGQAIDRHCLVFFHCQNSRTRNKCVTSKL